MEIEKKKNGHMECKKKKRPLLKEVNGYLICILCGGYYVDATTIVECLHTFCRSCIVKYLETNKFCPICDVQLHKVKPLLSLRPDSIIRSLVYKLIPGLYKNEIARRAESADNGTNELTDDDTSSNPSIHYYLPDEPISVSLKYEDTDKDSSVENNKDKTEESMKIYNKYLQCPANFRIRYLRKFLRHKYSLSKAQKVEICYSNEVIPNDFSLMDIAYTFHWERLAPMELTFRVYERLIIRKEVPNKIVSVKRAETITEIPKNDVKAAIKRKFEPIKIELKMKKKKIAKTTTEEKVEKEKIDKKSSVEKLVANEVGKPVTTKVQVAVNGKSVSSHVPSTGKPITSLTTTTGKSMTTQVAVAGKPVTSQVAATGKSITTHIGATGKTVTTQLAEKPVSTRMPLTVKPVATKIDGLENSVATKVTLSGKPVDNKKTESVIENHKPISNKPLTHHKSVFDKPNVKPLSENTMSNHKSTPETLYPNLKAVLETSVCNNKKLDKSSNSIKPEKPVNNLKIEKVSITNSKAISDKLNNNIKPDKQVSCSKIDKPVNNQKQDKPIVNASCEKPVPKNKISTEKPTANGKPANSTPGINIKPIVKIPRLSGERLTTETDDLKYEKDIEKVTEDDEKTRKRASKQENESSEPLTIEISDEKDSGKESTEDRSSRKRKNKKSRRHHHHHHKKRPPPATILHSPDTDCMKLKVKLNTDRRDKRKWKRNSPSPISSTSSGSSPDSERQTKSPDSGLQSKTTDEDLSSHSVESLDTIENHKDDNNLGRLQEMRAFRLKGSSEVPVTSVLLRPPSSITVSKITAAEKQKMEEEHQNDKNKPSLEIMLVNGPPKATAGKPEEAAKSKCTRPPPPGIIPISHFHYNRPDKEKNEKSSKPVIDSALDLSGRPVVPVVRKEIPKKRKIVKSVEKPVENKFDDRSMEYINQFIRPTWTNTSLRSLYPSHTPRLPTLMNFSSPKINSQPLPKLNEIKVGPRVPKPVQNQTVRHIPNPSALIMRHQISNNNEHVAMQPQPQTWLKKHNYFGTRNLPPLSAIPSSVTNTPSRAVPSRVP